jgi:hypothetical protein
MIFMKFFIYILLGYLSLWDYFNMLLLKTPTNLSEEHEHKIFYLSKKYKWSKRDFLQNFSNSQINLSEAWEHFFKTNKAHRAQKDISEALEQFHSSKRFKWSIRAILTNHSIILAPSNRCVQQGYLTQNKKQRLIHTRCSKQNSYHVPNKNIASSIIPMVGGIKRGCLPGHPQT